jgi:hypothetical protein
VRPTNEMAVYERHAYGMVSVRSTSMRDTSMRWLSEIHAYERQAYEMVDERDTPMGWPMGDARL